MMTLVLAALVTVRVSLDAPTDMGYELRAGETQKLGRTGPLDGYDPEDVIELSGVGGSIPVSLKFYDVEGLVASCPAVDVRLHDESPLCEPKFTLAGKTCTTTCSPTRSARKKQISRYLPSLYY